jgi:hypothetical protein
MSVKGILSRLVTTLYYTAPITTATAVTVNEYQDTHDLSKSLEKGVDAGETLQDFHEHFVKPVIDAKREYQNEKRKRELGL